MVKGFCDCLFALEAHESVTTEHWVFVVVGGAVLLLLLRWLLSAPPLPYVRREALFTPAERAFLVVLDKVAGERYRVFGKVRVADVLDVKPMRDRRAWWRAFTRISSKHFDYVLCDPADLSVVAVIELDDRSHQRPDRVERDAFIDEACQTAELPLLRVPARRTYVQRELREQLQALLEG